MSYTTVATQFIERDYRLLRGLFESRVMTVQHMADLYFDGRLDAARKRIWKLKNAKLLSERSRLRPYDPSILFLSRAGFELLVREKRLIDYPAIAWPVMAKRLNLSSLTLQHELDLMTAKAAVATAIETTSVFTIAEFSTWPRLFSFPNKSLSARGGNHRWMKPDAFIRIHQCDADGFDPVEHRFYMELDRSTEPQHRLQAKASAYVLHYRSGGFAKRFGAPPEAYRQFPFRVLFVCRTNERRNNLAITMLAHRPPILTMVWLTTFNELCTNALGPIWIRPVDYRNATAGTAFDPLQSPAGPVYRRQAQRQTLIDEHVEKVCLFDVA